MRAGEQGTHRRRRRSAAAPLLACALSVAAVSCEGDCWGSSTGPIDPPDTPLPVLQPRYVLAGVNGSALPFVISAGPPRVRLIADTLVFTGAGTPPPVSGTYVEIRVVGTTPAGGGAEVVTRTTSPARVWRRGTTYGQLLLDEFVGIASSGAQVQMQLATALFPAGSSNLFGPLGSYTFEPR
jgi:hypothetical protein